MIRVGWWQACSSRNNHTLSDWPHCKEAPQTLISDLISDIQTCTKMSSGPSFSVWDYVVFTLMLVVSAGIGVYYAFAGGGQSSSADFLVGGRSMTAVPVALSLTASFMSAITVLGTPVEVYQYGAIFILICFSYVLMVAVSSEIFLPIFYRLGITSTYEVRWEKTELEGRFWKTFIAEFRVIVVN